MVRVGAIAPILTSLRYRPTSTGPVRRGTSTQPTSSVPVTLSTAALNSRTTGDRRGARTSQPRIEESLPGSGRQFAASGAPAPAGSPRCFGRCASPTGLPSARPVDGEPATIPAIPNPSLPTRSVHYRTRDPVRRGLGRIGCGALAARFVQSSVKRVTCRASHPVPPDGPQYCGLRAHGGLVPLLEVGSRKKTPRSVRIDSCLRAGRSPISESICSPATTSTRS